MFVCAVMLSNYYHNDVLFYVIVTPMISVDLVLIVIYFIEKNQEKINSMPDWLLYVHSATPKTKIEKWLHGILIFCENDDIFKIKSLFLTDENHEFYSGIIKCIDWNDKHEALDQYKSLMIKKTGIDLRQIANLENFVLYKEASNDQRVDA